jgi:DNA-binding NtrC family response regulator
MRDQETKSLLVVEADPAERRLVSAVAARAGWITVGADCTETAVGLLQGPHGREVQAALLANWEEDTGPASIVALRESCPSLPVIVVAKSESVTDAVNAMRAGATDFLSRPVAPERLVEALAANGDRRKPAGELIPVSEKLAPALSLDQLVGSSPEYRAALAVAAKAARNRLPILIVGEPGTGKETVARAIHNASLRSRGRLVIVDCKAVPANVVDSELFGHVKGAFPGAFSEKSGRMLEADMGTLVLDEIAALPHSTQENLDRVLATGEVRPVGCNGSSSIDVRLIATSSTPLPESFNQMLGERICVTVVNLPPLRERSGDIPALARHLLQRFAEQELLPSLSIGNDALAVLMRYGWPGNVRQLASVLFRSGLQCDRGGLTAEDFPHIATQSRFTGRKSDFAPSISAQSSEAALSSSAGGVTLFTNEGHLRTLEEIEADIIRLAIGHYRGRMTEVARRLGIGRSTLYRKLSDIGIDTAA